MSNDLSKEDIKFLVNKLAEADARGEIVLEMLMGISALLITRKLVSKQDVMAIVAKAHQNVAEKTEKELDNAKKN